MTPPIGQAFPPLDPPLPLSVNPLHFCRQTLVILETWHYIESPLVSLWPLVDGS